MKNLLFLTFLIVTTASAQTGSDTGDVINYIIKTELLSTNGPGAIPPMILKSKTTAWDLDKKQIQLSDTLLDRGLYTQLATAPLIVLDKMVTSQHKLIVSNLLPDDPLFISKLDMFHWISFTTPVFFDNNRFCIVEIKGPDWRQAFLLQKITGKWEKKGNIGGWIL